ncbi:aminoglycoside phosphotransferase family protein, partial [bacterium]|nr:aminoglycoside phosphotransferase family protein [bacterium]
KYGFNVLKIKRIDTGAGSNVYYVQTNKGQYIFKNITKNDMNFPQNEPMLLHELSKNGIPVARLIKTIDGEYVWNDEHGEVYHMQEYISGETIDLNKAPDWFMPQSANLLGKIHKTLESIPELPIGIGENFFKHMTPENAGRSYHRTLETAKTDGNNSVVDDLLYRIKLLPILNDMSFDLSKFTRKNTHGDYFISQFICGKAGINAVIDWTTACVHPVCWEIIRSYTYSDPFCKDGELNIENFKKYVEEYLKEFEFKEYDLVMMPYLYFYQLGVCDYFNQYYCSKTHNKHIFLHQAHFSTLLLRWFEKNVYKLSHQLKGAF